MRQPAHGPRSLPTVVRGSFNLQPAMCNLQSEIALLDISGRRVTVLHSGSNDVSHLAPGVYFVRSARVVHKVVLSR
jgi:hypothetical protein